MNRPRNNGFPRKRMGRFISDQMTFWHDQNRSMRFQAPSLIQNKTAFIINVCQNTAPSLEMPELQVFAILKSIDVVRKTNI